jgi:quercetin dioxygenase-like cupin family protein
MTAAPELGDWTASFARRTQSLGHSRDHDRPGAPQRALGARRKTVSDAAAHFAEEAQGEPAGPGRYVHIDDVKSAEFAPGLTFRPVLGQGVLTNFVHFEPGAQAPRHVHEEEQIVITLDGEMTFDLDGEVRTMRKGDVAVVPAWVPHGAWTTDSARVAGLGQGEAIAPPGLRP